MFNQHSPKPKYQNIALIGAGGTGEVYHARRLSDDRSVAIKYLRNVDYDALQRFQREANNYMRQQHCPYIVDIIDFEFNTRRPYIVLEYCELGSARALNSKFWWVPDKIAALLTHVAAGIEAIHISGGFHRDIKPDNLLLTQDSRKHLLMKVSDFGLARLPWGLAGSFLTRTPAGTPEYIAPEILRGHPFTAAADIFSFGVTIEELFTGTRPAVGAKNLSCPSALRPLVGRMIAMDPSQRPEIRTVSRELSEATQIIKSQQQGLRLLGGAVIAGILVAALSKRR